jgi:CelD/BcsL family acetyltransferase involved in cellulose biosynthesis
MPVSWSVLPLPAALDRWRAAWHALVEERGLNPSLLPGWIETAAGAFGSPAEVEVLLGAEGGDLVAAVPLRRRTRRALVVPVRSLEVGAGLVNYHHELAARVPARQILEALVERAGGLGGWERLEAPNLVADGAADDAFASLGREGQVRLATVERERSPYVALQGGWEAYLATRNKAFRYSVRRQRRDAEAMPGATLRWYREPADVDALWTAVLAVEARSWKAREGRAITSRQIELGYNERLLPYLARERMLLACVYGAGEAPVAYGLCCVHRGWAGLLKTSYDENHSKLRPGAYVVQALIEQCFVDGRGEFDFLGDATPYKLEWTDSVRAHRDRVAYAPGALGRLLHALADRP